MLLLPSLPSTATAEHASVALSPPLQPPPSSPATAVAAHARTQLAPSPHPRWSPSCSHSMPLSLPSFLAPGEGGHGGLHFLREVVIRGCSTKDRNGIGNFLLGKSRIGAHIFAEPRVVLHYFV